MSLQEVTISKIVRSKRKTVALVVTQEATLVVRAPVHTPLEYIENLVCKKQAWIVRKLNEAAGENKVPEKKFVNGEIFLYFGETYELYIVEEACSDVKLDDNRLYLSKKALPRAREILIGWYKAEACKKIGTRCEFYAKTLGCKPASINITGARRRWGSCGTKGTLNFSWRLIMAPLEVIDYVVVHELVHLERLDHSKRFWNRVRDIIPDYKKRKKWLEENDKLLIL